MKLTGMDAARVAPYPGQYPERSNGHAVADSVTATEANNAGVVCDISRKTVPNPLPAEKLFHQDDNYSDRVIQDALDRANKILTGSNRRFEISIHEKTKEVMIKVIDTDTDETIKEIPPKKLVDVMVSLCEMVGILFDKKG